MTIASAYRNWVGAAVVRNDTVLATAAAAAATSLVVQSATGITTADTVVLLDGANTETKAVTAVVGNTLTVSALANAHPRGCYVFALPTSGFGPSAYLALKTFKVPDKITQLYDESRVGSLVVQRGVVQGLREGEWTFGGDVYADTFGYVLGAFFGSEDYTSGTAAPNSHAFAVKNTGNGQPSKLALFDYDGVNVRVVVGRISKLGLKFTPKALVTFTATMLTRASGVVQTFTPSFSATPQLLLLPTWRATLTIASAYSRLPLSFDVTLVRGEVENIPTMNGTQDPLDTFVGAATATVKGSYVKTGDTQLSKFLGGTTQKFVVSIVPWITGSTGVGLTLQISEGNYDEVEPILQGKAFNTETFSLTAVASATDASTSGGGISPCKVTLKDAIGAGVFV